MKNIFIVIAILISQLSYTQVQSDEMIKNFFIEYSKNPAKAVENIYKSSIWTSRLKDGIEDMKNEVQKYNIDYMGKYYGSELIVKKQLSNSFILYSYLVKYDRQPIRFIFKLYKPNDKWVLFSLKIDGALDEEIEEAAKIYNLNLDN
ncbi:hypothetical protein QWY99_04980 [Flavobacterium branchiarum]|uniref:DUF4878 domain-containing protein n=1 Tax=Flavobacterium branchiarum TaxID=1114870 RepID=A0ABV5FK46_9FLAO|nr:hypothetical protein [Flavobacterium branchiarum]MDN3672409.1 hypothetical protein [Flavobacterium branchiarum]